MGNCSQLLLIAAGWRHVSILSRSQPLRLGPDYCLPRSGQPVLMVVFALTM